MNCNIGIGNQIKINPTWWKETWNKPLPIETLISTVNDNKFVVSNLNICELDLDNDSEFRDITIAHEKEEATSILQDLAYRNQAIAKMDWVLDDEGNWYLDIYTIDGMTNITDELILDIVHKFE